MIDRFIFYGLSTLCELLKPKSIQDYKKNSFLQVYIALTIRLRITMVFPDTSSTI